MGSASIADFRRNGICVLVMMCLVVFGACAQAGDNDVIPEVALTSEVVLKVLVSAGIDASKDSDGDVTVKTDGQVFFINVNPEKSRVYFATYEYFRDSASMDDILTLCNRINDEVALVRASVVVGERNRLWLDYSFPTEAGVSSAQIVNLTKRFASSSLYVAKKDKEDILQ